MSETKRSAPVGKDPDYRIRAGSAWAGAWQKVGAVGVLGLIGAGVGLVQNPKRLAFSYLFSFTFFLWIGLGALFFVLIQYLTKANWSVTVRRSAEFLMSGLGVFLILVAPIIFSMKQLFPWVEPHTAKMEMVEEGAPAQAPHSSQNVAAPPEHPEGPLGISEERNIEPHGLAKANELEGKNVYEAKEEEEQKILEGKKPYLNKTFFLVRLVFYVFIWAYFAQRYFRLSTEQDQNKKLENTAIAQRLAPIATMLFALTITFAGFDWLMSLNPWWYSTIFGVYIFAGSNLALYSTLILMTMMMRRSGLITDREVNVEHYHDMGKLLFGFLVFWAYISFSQFFLIWYSNIPEELVFYHLRWRDNGGTWKPVSALMLWVHFAIPFWFLMSRNIKRRLPLLALGSIIMIVALIIEAYWIVMPNYGPFELHWLDAACFLGVGGIYFAYVLRQMEAHAVIPIGDPRLARALKFENA